MAFLWTSVIIVKLSLIQRRESLEGSDAGWLWKHGNQSVPFAYVTFAGSRTAGMAMRDEQEHLFLFFRSTCLFTSSPQFHPNRIYNATLTALRRIDPLQ